MEEINSARTYIDLRMIFNKRRKNLTLEELSEICSKISYLKKDAIFNSERKELNEFELDVELEMDSRPKEEVRKHIEPEIRFIQTIKSSFDVMVTILDTSTGTLWKETERELIRAVLIECRGNRTQASKILGISIRTLRNKINEYTHNNMVEEYEISRLRN